MDTENTDFILDPEAEKYVFDPANPTQFKAYDLLLKITKERNNIVLFSFNYFLEIFGKEIFDNEWDKELWDKPENYNDLNYIEKAEVYLKNFAEGDLIKKINRKSKKFKKQHFLKSLFRKFIFGTKLNNYVDSIESILDIRKMENLNVLPDICNNLNLYAFGRKLISIQPGIYANHLIFFFDGVQNHIPFYEMFSPIHISTIITEVRYFPKIKEMIGFPNGAFRPILLKDIRHINILLDYLYRDVTAIQARENYVETPISYLQSATLQNYFSIEKIALNELGDKKEIYFMGENGSGKTLLLQALFLALKGNPNEGIVFDYLKSNDNASLILQATDNQGEKYEFLAEEKTPKNSFANLFAYGVNRRKRENEENKENYFTLFNEKEGFLESPVLWLQHLDYKQLKGGDTGISLEMAKVFLEEILDRKVNIEVTADDVFFYEKGAKLTFEQLSDGYKSVLVWVCDLLKRFCDKQPQAISLKDFRGIVLIDEVDLFLSPTWQYKIVRQLRKWFQNVQFIITTHSPTVILGASEEAVFYKIYKENGKSKVSEPFYNKDFSNLMMNGIITSPLFDLETARPFAYKPNENELETADFHAVRIHKQLKVRLNEQKKLGKNHFSVAEIDDLIANIIQESQAPYEKDDKN